MVMDELNFEQIARELLIALRGRRSQTAWSRRLGYKSNVAYSWESGRRWPTAAELLRAAGRSGQDVAAALTQFYGHEPPWLAELAVDSPEAVARLLNDLRGNTPINDLAAISGISRYSISR